MAALDLQEQEQVEAFKSWWKENGNFILTILCLILVGLSAWRGWDYYQHKQANEAVTMYESFMNQVQGKDSKRINEAASTVMNQYGSTIYAAYAALIAASVNEQSDDANRAKTQLQWVIDHAKEESLKDVARLRLAAIWLDEKKYAEVEHILKSPHPAAFEGLYADMRGDLLSAQGKKAEALKSYKVAYEKTDSRSQYRSFIQMKMDDLGVTQ